LKQRSRQRFEAEQMKIFRAVLGLTALDKIRNTEIRARLSVKKNKKKKNKKQKQTKNAK